MNKIPKSLMLCLCVLIGVLLPVKHVLADMYEVGGIEVPDLGTPIPRTVTNDEIWSALKQGNINLVVNLIENRVLEEFRKKLGSETKIKYELAKWLKNGGGQAIVDELNKIMHDSSKTEEEKAINIFEIVTNSLSLYESQMQGVHRLKLQHSIGLAVTRLTWDNKEKISECHGLEYQVFGSFGEPGYSASLVPYTEYLLQVPDYYIYKIVNGESKLLRKYKGFRSVSRNRVSINFDNPWVSLAEGLYEYANFDRTEISTDRRHFDDIFSDLYNKGDSVSYKIISDTSPYKGRDCGESKQRTSSVVFDSNGDYLADFIPKKEYDRFRMKIDSWLIPVTYFLLE